MIDRMEFGKTGHASTRVIFGAAALSRVDQATADTILPRLFEAGVNHIDTASTYGDSELRLAPWLAKYRSEFFLATKTRERTGEGARASLERSLARLGVDQVDLIQLHNLVEPDEWEVAHAENGAVAALSQARDEGLVRFIGITGHGLRIPKMHLASLERFDFDSVLLPYNHLLMSLPQYRADAEALLAVCAERQIAVQTIKSIARRRWEGERPQDSRSWYEPLADEGAIRRAVRFVLSRPQLFLTSSSDFTLLPYVLAASMGDLSAPDEAEIARDSEQFAMVPLFDGGELERI